MPFSWESEELWTGDCSLISEFRQKKLQISQPTTMVNSLGTAKEFYLFTDRYKTLQTSPFFILFSLAALSFKIWSVFNLLISKIKHTHPSEKRLGGFPDRKIQGQDLAGARPTSSSSPSPHSFVCSEVKWNRSVVSDSLQPHGLGPPGLLCQWDFPGKGTGAGCHLSAEQPFFHSESHLGIHTSGGLD